MIYKHVKGRHLHRAHINISNNTGKRHYINLKLRKIKNLVDGMEKKMQQKCGSVVCF